MSDTILNFLLTRKSAPIHEMTGPGPSAEELDAILRVATRVPDHGRLTPWRFILYRGEAQKEVGKHLAALAEQREGPLAEKRREQELARLTWAPLVIGVVHVPRENPKIPQWEMLLSGGAVVMKLCLAANALGFATNWLTGWYSDLPEGRAILGLKPEERVVGLVHIGRHDKDILERPRPDPATLVSDYAGPMAG